MTQYLGVDIGGTNVKFGVVDESGNMTDKIKFKTAEFVKKGDFIASFSDVLSDYFSRYPSIKSIGIGVPGYISKDRKTTVLLANIPSLNGVNIISLLENKFKGKTFYLENDANAAAIGEYHFGTSSIKGDFIMVTLGTGVGGAVMLEGSIFKGGDGNALEIGHTIASTGKVVEASVGKKGLIKTAEKLIKKNKFPNSVLNQQKNFSYNDITDAARNGDELALKVFSKAGKHLGEGIISGVMLFDIKNIIIGGGVSQTFMFMEPSLTKRLRKFLPNYYLDNIKIELATLGNDAGIIGAACLCFKK